MSHAVLSEEERRAAFSGTAPKVSRQTIFYTIAACLVLGFGGIIVDHFFNGASKVGTTPIPTGSLPPPLQSTPADLSAVPPLTGALMGLAPAGGGPAPAIALHSLSGKAFSLAALRGKVVLLSFFDSACDDICPVLSKELALARDELAAEHLASRVAVIVVNSDPALTAPGGAGPARRALAASGGTFLTGSLAALDRVWKAYGITIDVQQNSSIVSHNNLLYFLGPSGRLVATATPIGNEVKNGSYELAPSTLERFARGIADEAGYLARKIGSAR